MWNLITKANEAVPATKWAVGVAGVIAAFSLVTAKFDGAGGTFAAGIAIIVLMIIMLLFSAAASAGSRALKPLGIFLAWSFLLLFVISCAAIATSVFIDKPKPFIQLSAELSAFFGSAKAREALDERRAEETQRVEAERKAEMAAEDIRKKIKELQDQLATQADSQIPEKAVISIGGGLYKTTSYWSGGSRKRETYCQPELDEVEGMTIVGADETRSYDTRRILFERSPNPRGCAPKGHCDSHNEFCVTHYRTDGCYVTTNWLDWYRDRQLESNLLERNEDVCAA